MGKGSGICERAAYKLEDPENFRKPLSSFVDDLMKNTDREPARPNQRGSWDSAEGYMAHFPFTEVPASMGHLSGKRCDARTDRRVQAKLDQVMQELKSAGYDLDPELAAPVVELAEALPRAMARRGIHLTRASAKNIADNIIFLGVKQDPRTFTPPLLVLQGLYPQISMNGWNLRFKTQRHSDQAVQDELSHDHQARWHKLYLYKHNRAQERNHG